jgi:hypothetical protein
VQPSSAQVRVSPKARTIGSAPAARRLPVPLSTTMLGLFPHPSRANAARPRHAPSVGLAVVVLGRLPLAGSSAGVVLVDTVGLGWLGVARRARPHRGSRPASPGSAAGRGVQRSREPVRSAAVDPGPGGRLAVTELLARVGGSSVSLNCPLRRQGGCHVDMVVGADHRGRGGVGVWRDAATGPLTALRHQPVHSWRSCWTRPTAWRRGRWVRPSWPKPTTQRCPPGGLGYAAGIGPSLFGHGEELVAGQAAPFGLVDDGDGGLGVGLAGGGHGQPQPVAHRSDQPRLGLSRCFLWAVAGMGGVAGGGWPAGVRVVLAAVVGWGFDRQMPRQGALLGVPPGGRPPRLGGPPGPPGARHRHNRPCPARSRPRSAYRDPSITSRCTTVYFVLTRRDCRC